MAAPYPDLVFVNGRVLTVDARFSVASALAVTGGTVSAVGDRREVMAAVGPGTRVVDLAGGTLLPGINDAHLHGCAFGMTRPPLSVDLAAPGVRSIADVAEAVRAAAERTPPGEWVFGHGWDPGCCGSARRTRSGCRTGTTWTRSVPTGPCCCTRRRATRRG